MSLRGGLSWLVLALCLLAPMARAQDGEADAEPAEAEAEEEAEEEEAAPHELQDAIVDSDAPRSQPSGELPTPRPVYVGIYVNDVPSLDLQTNRCLVDFYLWFRWQGDDIDPSTTYEFMNAVESWDLLRAPVYVDEEDNPLPEDLGDGWRYQVFHVQGHFGHPFDVRAYPFDSQEIVIAIEDTDLVVEDMTYVVDEGTYTLPPTLAIPGWDLGEVRAEVIQQDYPTNFGDTRRPIGEDRYSRFRYSVVVARPVIGYAATTILPIAIVMLITMVMFLIDPKYFEGKLGLGITSLISAVALQLTAAGDLPSTGYLVLLDHIYNLSYGVIFLALLASVWSVRVHDRGEIQRAERIDRIMLVVSMLVFFGGTGLLVAFGR
ncbi:MAG: hypothetical protein U0234_03470 [Sandaracinus sp.]